jgi:gamma-glutamyltranspeptidase/glutathione hydrolase
VLYRGSLGRAIADWVTANGGLLGRDDLTAYRVIERRCFEVDSLGWRLACNPSPAVGGRLLVRILQQMDDRPRGAWTADDIAVLAAAMERAFAERTGMLASDAGAADRAAATAGGALPIASPATSHTSAVDSDGLAVAITTSTGYSSGVIVPGTGILLNNTLGELELCPGGYHALKPGERLRSNMNPTVARRGTAVLAFGAAGADRIASAMAQVWLTRAALDRPIEVAVAQPRCHVERHDGAPVLAFEPGVETGQARLALRPFESPHMYFGGVQAAERGADGRLAAAADPRRDGAAVVVQGASPGLISGSSSAGAIP